MPRSATGTRNTAAGSDPVPNRVRSAASALRGFTLLELLAVLLIMALMMGLFMPTIGARTGMALRAQARELASTLELARQRAVMTGVPHRVLVDVDEGFYRVEWYVSEARSLGQAPEPPAELDLSANTPISLSPPRDGTVDYYPIPHALGGGAWLGDAFDFAGVETAGGMLDDGEVQIVFDRDGTTDSAEIVIDQLDGRRIFVVVAPLLETVGIYEDED